MKKFILTAVFAAVLASACTTASDSSRSGPAGPDLPEKEASPPRTAVDRFRKDIGDSKGVIVLTDDYGEDDTVRIYDKGGALWYEFSYYDESAFDELESINTDFRPFAFHPDYLLLAMRVVSEDTALYEVVVNEEKDLRKFVRKDDENLEFEPFEKHILSVYAVDFDPKTNPLRESPGGEPLKGDFSKVPIFKPANVDGEWLEVVFRIPETEGGNSNDAAEKGPSRGWIRWRDGSYLTVALFYVP